MVLAATGEELDDVELEPQAAAPSPKRMATTALRAARGTRGVTLMSISDRWDSASMRTDASG